MDPSQAPLPSPSSPAYGWVALFLMLAGLGGITLWGTTHAKPKYQPISQPYGAQPYPLSIYNPTAAPITHLTTPPPRPPYPSPSVLFPGVVNKNLPQSCLPILSRTYPPDTNTTLLYRNVVEGYQFNYRITDYVVTPNSAVAMVCPSYDTVYFYPSVADDPIAATATTKPTTLAQLATQYYHFTTDFNRNAMVDNNPAYIGTITTVTEPRPTGEPAHPYYFITLTEHNGHLYKIVSPSGYNLGSSLKFTD